MDISALSSGFQSSRLTSRSVSSADGASGAGAASERDESSSSAAKRAPAGAEGLYISPVLKYDQTARLAVLYFRDFDTGETRDQIPAEKVVKQYRQSGGEDAESASAANTGTEGGGGEGSAGSVAPTPGIGSSFLDGPGGIGGSTSVGDTGAAAAAGPPPVTGGGGDVGGTGSTFSVTV